MMQGKQSNLYDYIFTVQNADSLIFIFRKKNGFWSRLSVYFTSNFLSMQ